MQTNIKIIKDEKGKIIEIEINMEFDSLTERQKEYISTYGLNQILKKNNIESIDYVMDSMFIGNWNASFVYITVEKFAKIKGVMIQ